MTRHIASDRRTLAGKTWSGALWLSGNTLLTRFANIAVTAVVARIVAPSEFGVFAIAVVVLNVIGGFAELGLASAISRRDLDLDRIAPTVTTIAIASATTLAGAMVVFATPIAQLLGSVHAVGSIRILALAVFLTGIFAVPGAQLQRDFRQGTVFRAGMAGFVVGNVVLLALASATGGADAFAWSRVIGQLVTGGIMIARLGTPYLPGFSRAAVPALLAFGLPLAAANTLSQVVVNIDNAFVGHILGPTELGLYAIAFNVSSWAGAALTSVLNGMVLPAITAVRADGGDVRAVVARSTQAVAFVAAPIAAATCVLAAPLIETIYGHRWLGAAGVLSVLAAFGLASVLCLLFANIVIAMGKTVNLLVVQAAAVAVLVPAIYFGLSRFGLIGVGYAHLVVVFCVTLPCYLVFLRSATGAGPALLARSIAWPLAAAAFAATAGWLASAWLENPLLHLVVGASAGGATYAVATIPISRRLLASIRPRAEAAAPALLVDAEVGT
jgi:PST family polysaccharide transporter